MSDIDSIALKISRRIMLDIWADTIPVDVRRIGQLQAKIQCVLEEYIREQQAALSQPNEPYKYELSYDGVHGRVYEYFDADNKERAYIWAKDVFQHHNPKIAERVRHMLANVDTMRLRKPLLQLLVYLLPAMTVLIAYSAYHETLFQKPACQINCESIAAESGTKQSSVNSAAYNSGKEFGNGISLNGQVANKNNLRLN